MKKQAASTVAGITVEMIGSGDRPLSHIAYSMRMPKQVMMPGRHRRSSRPEQARATRASSPEARPITRLQITNRIAPAGTYWMPRQFIGQKKEDEVLHSSVPTYSLSTARPRRAMTSRGPVTSRFESMGWGSVCCDLVVDFS